MCAGDVVISLSCSDSIIVADLFNRPFLNVLHGGIVSVGYVSHTVDH